MSYALFAHMILLEAITRRMVDESGGVSEFTASRKSRPMRPGPGTTPTTYQWNKRAKDMASNARPVPPTTGVPGAKPPLGHATSTGGSGLLGSFNKLSTLGKAGVGAGALAAGYAGYRMLRGPGEQQQMPQRGRRPGGYR